MLGGFMFYFYFISRVYSVCVSDELQRIIQNPTYSSKRLHIIYHLVSHGVGLILTLLFALTDNFGVSFSLICWNRFKTGSHSFLFK